MRRRIAWVSPLPPAQSGIADYSAGLLRHLADWYDLDAVVDPRAAGGGLLGPDEALARHEADPYDLFVHHVGNSGLHTYLLPLLWRCRGLVVLHDYVLSGLVFRAAEAGRWPVSLPAELEREGRPDLAARWRAGAADEREILQDTALNRRVLEAADAVLVHSRWSWHRVRRAVSVPVAHVPVYAQPPVVGSRVEERRRLGLPLDAFVIASLGEITPAKRVDSLLRALASLPPEARGRTRAVLVGAARPDYHRELAALASRLGVGPLVRWTGRVPAAELLAYARAADVCVQLRFPTVGESSGVLPQMLAAGATCVVSDQGAMAEIPDEAAWKVRSPDHEVEDLAAALTRLHADPADRRRFGEAARRYATEHLDPRDIARRYAALIELTAGRRPAPRETIPESEEAIHATQRPHIADCRLHHRLQELPALRADADGLGAAGPPGLAPLRPAGR